jgi:hypothetical protein
VSCDDRRLVHYTLDCYDADTINRQGPGIVRLFGVSAQRHAGDDVVGRTRQHE